MTPEEYKQLSIKEFTRAARIYDSDHAGIYEMCKDDYPYLLEELEKEPFDSVLDCGCGTGPVIELLHEKYPDKHYTGLDLTPEMIRSIRTLCGVCLCSFVESKAFKIAIVPSADRSMDTCTVCQTRRGHDYVVMNR